MIADPDAGELAAPTELAIAFHGTRGGCADLTWSQRGIWHLQRHLWPHHFYLNLMRCLRLPAGLDLPRLTTALRLLVEEHEALRTTVHRARDGRPRQRVHDRGELPLSVYEAGVAGSGAVAERLTFECKGHAFSDDEWPLRMAAVVEAGTPRYLVLVVSHLAVDMWGMGLLHETLSRLLTTGGPVERGRHHPLDQAAVEASAAGRRTGRRAVDYWRHTLMTVPQAMFPAPSRGADLRRSYTAELTSPALAMAAGALGARHGASTSAVILAATGALLTTVTGTPRVVLRLFAANRYGVETRGMVGVCTQPALFVLDPDVRLLSELIDRSWAASLLAFRHSRYPADEVEQAMAEVNRRRGVRLRLLCHVRDGTWESRRAGPASGGGASAEDIEAARGASRLRLGATLDRRQDFRLDVGASDGRSMHLTLTADPRLLPRDDLGLIARGIETLLVRAVGREVELGEVGELTGAAPRPRPPSMVLVDHCWVEPAAVRDLLCSVPGVVDAAVRVVPHAAGGARIVGHVATGRLNLTPEALHHACLVGLSGRPATMTPHEYVVHRLPEAADGPLPAVDAQPVLRAGTGRPPG